jgi:hypothetical protein
MRFNLRIQSKWPVNLTLVYALAGLALAILALLLGPHSVPRWISGSQLVCSLMVVVTSWPTCEVRENGLLLRLLWRKKLLIPYESLMELKARTDGYGVFAVKNDGKRLTISVSQTPRFLREVYRRCPRLNPATGSPSFGLIAG